MTPATSTINKESHGIEIQDLYKSFGEFHIHRGVNLKIKKGRITYIMGGSGAGKSLLLKQIMGFIRPDSGSIFINGVGMHNADRRTIKEIRRDMGILFQHGALFDSMSVYDNIAFPMVEQLELTTREIREDVERLLDSVGLSAEHSSKMPSELSGGQRKRVALARAIALKPSIIMYDEPTTGLDPITTRMVSQLIKYTNKKYNLTSIVISHDVRVAFNVAEELAFLKDGKVQFSGKPKDIFKLEDQDIHEFFSYDQPEL